MRKQEIAKRVMKILQEKGLSKKISIPLLLHILGAFELTVFNALKEDGLFRIRGVGTLKVVDAKPRKIKHPRTGKIINVPSRKRIKFIPSKKLTQELK